MLQQSKYVIKHRQWATI